MEKSANKNAGKKDFYGKIKISYKSQIMTNRKRKSQTKPMTEGKSNVFRELLNEYNIKTAENIQDALRQYLIFVTFSIFTDFESLFHSLFRFKIISWDFYIKRKSAI